VNYGVSKVTYISKGAILRESGREQITVTRCGCDYSLHGIQATLWLGGRFGIAVMEDEQTAAGLRFLESQGLIEMSDDTADVAGYRMLSNCVICQAAPVIRCSVLGRKERKVWKWIMGAGFKLRISELVMLMEQNIKPVPELFGKDNWHMLVDMIYTTDTIVDGVLDFAMERSTARNATVDAVLGLLRKKRILLV
jgi:hypothetical protein